MSSGEARLICVAYDVPNNKRRSRIRKILKSYGTSVQYSVFECWLSNRQTESMREELAKVATDEDRIRFYDICHACHRATTVLGTSRKSSLEESYIF